MACVSVMGFGSYILWPQAIAWNDVSSHTFLLLALAMLVQFARVVFLGNPAHRAWRASAIALSVALLATAVAVQGCGAEVIVVSVGAGVFLSSVWVFALLIWRALRGDRLAWLWFVAYLPLSVLVSLTIVDAFGWISVPSLPVEATLYGLMFEMPLLLLGLVQHAKAAHTQRVQARALAAVDPDTGFVPARAFYPLAEQQWNATLDARAPMVVAFVQVAHARGGSHQAMQAHAADPQREPTLWTRLGGQTVVVAVTLLRPRLDTS